VIKVYIGDVAEYLSDIALLNDSTSTLLSREDVDYLTNGTYYTSLADLGSLSILGAVMRSADVIVYSPPAGRWSDDHNGKSSMQEWTEDYLRIFSLRRSPIIENFSTCDPGNKKDILALQDTRKSNLPHLWSVGCSITAGVGVEHNQTYGYVLGNMTGRPVSFLSKSGSSIIWAADQILRSDIRTGDIIIWGLTGSSRFPYFTKGSLNHIKVGQLHTLAGAEEKEVAINYLLSDDLLYRSITAISQVINFCKLANAKLLLVSLLDDVVVEYFRDYSNFLMLYKLHGREQTEVFIDLGTDEMHPGPLSHQYFADQIFQEIKYLNWISDEVDFSSNP